MPGLKALVLVFACVLAIVKNITAQETPCDSQPCLNNGWCADEGASYKCTCRPGFTGVHCETQVIRKLTITVKSTLYDLFIDGVRQNCTNKDNWTLADEILLAPTNRLIGLMAVDTKEDCAGVLASVTGDFLVSDAQWRCNPNGDISWQDLGFNDTLWPLAWELGTNDNITRPSGCDNVLHGVPSISPNANWIWVESMANAPAYHQTIYCRQYIPICEYESPCHNAGTCNRNNNTICSCLVGFIGEYCENVDSKQLNLTAKDHLYAVYVDGVSMTLENGADWRKADSLTIFSTSRLVAVMAIQLEGSCPGILVSVEDSRGDYVVSNVSWKCTSVAPVGWAELGFDDSDWMAAAVVRKNALSNDTECEQLDVISGISEEAYWIWTDSTEQHVTVYCRGLLPICDVHPCNNGGTCNANARDLCSCPPDFTGTHCEEAIVTEVTAPFTKSMDQYNKQERVRN